MGAEGYRRGNRLIDFAEIPVIPRWLFPRFKLADLPAMLGIAALGAMLAGIYGALHDQITYSISTEYFTKLKFPQFHYADFGWGDRAFAATVGFLATWWVGFIIAWLFARRHLPNQSRACAYRRIGASFALVLIFGVACAALGYAYGEWRGPASDDSNWSWARRLQVEDLTAFVRTAYIHNASYLGGLIGLTVALLAIRSRPNIS